MKIILAETMGMCYGVNRALDLTLKAIEGYPKVATLGPLVHNQQVTEYLAQKGVPCQSLDQLGPDDAVIIRSHGVGPKAYQHLSKQNTTVIDGTCPFVAKALEYAQSAIEGGYFIIILGDPHHAEIQGYQEWLGDQCLVVPSPDFDFEVKNLPKKIALIAQTTESQDNFDQLVEKLTQAGCQLLTHNTICLASQKRRQAAETLAAQADLVLVIGGKHSANTGQLGGYCRNIQPNTHVIEDYKDIEVKWLENINTLGITAGASTPEWIIKEVVEKMEEFKDQVHEQDAQSTEVEQEMNFSEMEAQMGCREFQPGDVVKGTVVKISSDEILVDIGYKSEGIIPAFELAFTKVDPYSIAEVGDEMKAEVIKEDRDGNIVLSRKNALFEEKIDRLEEAFEQGEPIEATVIDVVKGGLLIDVGMRGFVPASHVERGYVKDLNDYLNQTFMFKIIELNRGAKKIILSRKALLEEEYQVEREKFWASIEEGETRKGIVKRLTDFGAFIDVGGCDGLLHVSEMGWGKIAKPSDVVSINDEIDVYILKVDREKEKVSLSLKQLIPNPWDMADTQYDVGEIYPGKVMRTADFGAFIQLEPGLEGLAHISQLARFRVNKVEDVLSAGQEVPVKILDIDMDRKRISLSVKEAIDLPHPDLVEEDADEIPEVIEEVVEEVNETPEVVEEVVAQEETNEEDNTVDVD